MTPVSWAADASLQLGLVYNNATIGAGIPITFSAGLQGKNHPLANLGLVVGLVPSRYQIEESVAPSDPVECSPGWDDPTCDPTESSDTRLYVEKKREYMAPLKVMGRWTPLPEGMVNIHLQAGALFREQGSSFIGGGTVDVVLSKRWNFSVDLFGGRQFGCAAMGLTYEFITGE